MPIDWQHVFTSSQDAGKDAAARSPLREVVECYDQALNALTYDPKKPETKIKYLEQAIDIRLNLRTALLPFGEFGRILKCLREADEFARELDDKNRLGEISGHMSNYFWRSGQPQSALDSGNEVKQSIESVEGSFKKSSLEVLSDYRISRAYHALGRYEDADYNAAKAMETLEAKGNNRANDRLGLAGLPYVLACTVRVLSLAELGKFTQANPIAEEAIKKADASSQPFTRCVAYFGRGILNIRRDIFPGAIDDLKKSHKICEEENIATRLPRTAAALGYAYARSGSGNINEGISLLEEAVKKADSMRFKNSQSLQLAWLCEAYQRKGDLDKAIQPAIRAIRISEDHNEEGNKAWANYHLGNFLNKIQPKRGISSHDQAKSLANKLGMETLKRKIEAAARTSTP